LPVKLFGRQVLFDDVIWKHLKFIFHVSSVSYSIYNCYFILYHTTVLVLFYQLILYNCSYRNGCFTYLFIFTFKLWRKV
jgi:hypothetical protein